MREIKFRALDTDGKWWYFNLRQTLALRATLKDSLFELLDFEDGNVIATLRYDTLGRYTGLKDENGLEIYESDILTSNHPDYTPNYKWTVEWKDAGFYPFNDGDEQSHGNFESMEVIGNVYENKELING